MLSFGKHKGKRIRDVPRKYLRYLASWELTLSDDEPPRFKLGERADAECQRILERMGGLGPVLAEKPYLPAACGTFGSDLTALDAQWVKDAQKFGGKRLWEHCYAFMARYKELTSGFPSTAGRHSAALYLNVKQRDVVEARKHIRDNRLCARCSRYMPPIGHARANGRGHDDWDSRRLHKRCWQRALDGCVVATDSE